MNSEKHDSGLLPFGLPLFVAVVGATLVYSAANTLLRLNTTTAPMFAIGLASSILLVATLAAMVGEEEAFYVKGFATIVAMVIVGLGIMNAAAGHHPEQAGIIVVGIVLAGMLAFTLAPRSEPPAEEADERAKPPIRPVVGVVVMLAAVVGLVIYSQVQTSGDESVATVTATSTPTATVVASATTGPTTGGTVIAISAGDNFFEPAELSAAPGATVTFEVTNSGKAPHNFALAGGPKIDLIAAGQKMTLDFTMPASGEVRFACEFHPPGMVGVIKVQ